MGIAYRDDRGRNFQVMARQPFTCALFHPPRILFPGAMGKARWASEGSPTQATRLISLYAQALCSTPTPYALLLSQCGPRPSSLSPSRQCRAGNGLHVLPEEAVVGASLSKTHM